jgi:hypothetical protein
VIIITDVNFIAVIIAAIVNMALGYAWYGPLFGKQWMKLTGRTKEDIEKGKKDMPMVMGTMFVGALVMAYVLAVFISLTNSTGAVAGAMIGFWAWLGFVATTMLQDVLYEKKNKNLAAINMGYNLTALVLNGAIIASFS